MKFRMRVKNDRRDWWEDFDESDAIDQGSAEECGRKIIENYNATLYPGDLPRTVLEVQMGGDGKRAHDWGKTNLVTVMGRGGSNWDTLRCRACGCEARRYGLNAVQRVGKWKAAKWDVCNPNAEAHGRAVARTVQPLVGSLDGDK